jgi:hypothetical protein
VHFTQSCDEDVPQLITHVETTQAPITDEHSLSAIHTDLAEKQLLPDQHLVDAGDVTIDNLIQSQSGYEVDLIGPTLKTHWYQAETGSDLTHFAIDWEAETVTCPQNRISSSWTPVQEAGKSLIKVKFSQYDCKRCPSQTLCTGTTRRTLTLHPKEQMQTLFAADELVARRNAGTDPYFSFQTGHEPSGLRWVFDFATGIQSGHDPIKLVVFTTIILVDKISQRSCPPG